MSYNHRVNDRVTATIELTAEGCDHVSVNLYDWVDGTVLGPFYYLSRQDAIEAMDAIVLPPAPRPVLGALLTLAFLGALLWALIGLASLPVSMLLVLVLLGR